VSKAWPGIIPRLYLAPLEHARRLAAADRMEKAVEEFLLAQDAPARRALEDASFEYRRAKADEEEQK
jgi:hypothetical protein